MDFFFLVTTTWNLPKRAAAAALYSAMSCFRSIRVFGGAPARHESEHNSAFKKKKAKSSQQPNTEKIIAILSMAALLEYWDKLTQKA